MGEVPRVRGLTTALVLTAGAWCAAGGWASPAGAQAPSPGLTFSVLTDVHAAACVQPQFAGGCRQGLRARAVTGAPAVARVVVELTATCTWVPAGSEDQSGGEVRTVVGLPPRVLVWKPCGDYGVPDVSPDQAPGLTYPAARSDSRPYAFGVGRNGTRSYPVSVTASTGFVARSVLAVSRSRFKLKRTRRIWDYQFDTYINTCINDGLQLRASGANLYCTVVLSPASSRVAFLLRPARQAPA